MPSSAVRTFDEPDDFAASFLGMDVEMTILRRGRFEANVIRIDLGCLHVRRLSDNLPRIAHMSDVPEEAIISFRTEPGPRLMRDGAEMLTTNIVWRRSDGSYFLKSDGLASWGACLLRLEDLVSLGEALVGCDLKPPKDALTVTPPPAAMAKLQRLHAAAGQLAEDAPAVIAHPEAARGLEQALIEAMIDCLSGGEIEEDRTAQRQHAAIMRRFHRVVEEHVDKPLYIPQLCREVGASERTLLACCQEQLGMGPKHYLLLRRMHMVRRALRESTPGTTTVTEAATQYGFWQFGRFAVEYKALFGEAPSATLTRPV